MKKTVSIFGRIAVLAMFFIGMSTAPLAASNPPLAPARQVTAMAEAPAPGGELYAEAPSAEVVAEKKAMREESLYFEPTEAVAKSDWKAIQAQHKRYAKAKKNKDWGEARRLALFYFTRAWCNQNQAVEIISDKERWGDISELKVALNLLEEGRYDLSLAEKAGHHKTEWQDCKKKLNRVRASVEKQIADLLAK